MLEFYLESKFKLLQLRECAVGEHLDPFADWLHSDGYRRRPAQLLLRGAAHLGHWASNRGVSIDRFDQEVLNDFACHLDACACKHAFRGRDRYNAQGAYRFVEHLQDRGFLPHAKVEAQPAPVLAAGFRDWMRTHRGASESTTAQYVSIAIEFLIAAGDDTAVYNATLVREFILAGAGRAGKARAKSIATAIRMFLRFLAAYGHCSPDIIAAVPRIAHWKLSSLPRYIPAQDVERLVTACNPNSLEGSRNRAILLLLARLALRAGDVRDLRLSDIDWSHARLRVMGKGRCETRLPLPQ